MLCESDDFVFVYDFTRREISHWFINDRVDCQMNHSEQEITEKFKPLIFVDRRQYTEEWQVAERN